MVKSENEKGALVSKSHAKAGIEKQIKRTCVWTQPGKQRVGQAERVALVHAHYRM